MDELVIATGNPHKVAELRAILGGLGLRVVGLKDLQGAGEGPFQEPDETGDTFEANATIKALSYARQTGRMCLADDSGLEIDALGGRPGVISSHYCTDGDETGMARDERDRLNNERMLRELEGVSPEERGARFVCVMVLAAGHAVQFERGGGSILPPFGPAGPKRTGDLPHWEVPNATYFVTFRVHEGSLTPAERQVVLDACKHWHEDRIWLHLCVVMPDHVHMVFRFVEGDCPGSLSRLLHSIKSYSAMQINAKRRSHGRIWQREYFDRVMRSDRETRETITYVELNSVRRGLAEKAYDYPFLWRQELGLRPSRRQDAAAPRGEMRGILAVARGEFEGRIGVAGEVPRGENGFGYDPLFLVAPEFERTSAEMDSAEKNSLSHRARAAQALAKILRSVQLR